MDANRGQGIRKLALLRLSGASISSQLSAVSCLGRAGCEADSGASRVFIYPTTRWGAIHGMDNWPGGVLFQARPTPSVSRRDNNASGDLCNARSGDRSMSHESTQNSTGSRVSGNSRALYLSHGSKATWISGSSFVVRYYAHCRGNSDA